VEDVMFKTLVKKAFNHFGIDIVKKSKSPSYSFLGLKQLPIKTIIDIGANNGQFASEVSKAFPQAAIYCFEPQPKPFAELNLWAEKQSNRKIKTYNLALGETEGFADFIEHTDHSPSSSFLTTTEVYEGYYPVTKGQKQIQVKVTTLDKCFKDSTDSLEQDILLKLDVQGYEDRVIRGGIEIFGKSKACLLEVNLDGLYKDQATFKDISFMLYDLGYKYGGNLNQAYAEDGHVIYTDAVFVK